MNKKIAILIVSLLILLKATNAQDPKLVIPIADAWGASTTNFSPDGKFIVSTPGKVVKIWEVSSGKIIHNLKGSKVGFGSAFFTNDNKYVINTNGRYVSVWEVITEKLLYTIDNASEIINICISTDQKNIITSGWNGTIKTCDLTNGKLLKTFGNENEGKDRKVYVNFSSDQKYVITVNLNDSVAKIWDWLSGKLIDSLKGLNKVDEDFSAVFSPGNKLIITKSGELYPQVWNASNCMLLYTKNYNASIVPYFNGGNRFYLLFSPNGKYILSGSDKNSVEVFNALTGDLLFRIEGPDGQEDQVLSRISPDSKYVIISSSDGTTKVLQLSTGKLIHNMQKGHKEYVNYISFSNDGKYCVTSSRDCTIKIWNILTGQLVKTLKGQFEVEGYGDFLNDSKYQLRTYGQFSFDSKYIVNGIRNWEVGTGKLVKYFEPEENVLKTITSPQGKYVICFYEADTVRVWSVSTNKLLFSSVDCIDYYKSFFSPDEKHLITSPKDSIAKIWNLSTGKLINTLTIEKWNNVKFFPDSKSFITYSRNANSNGTKIKVWETSTGNLLKIIQEDGNFFECNFSSDSKLLLISSLNGNSRIWEVNTGNY